MDSVIHSFAGLHDNIIIRYSVDFDRQSLHLETKNEAGNKISVNFSGVLAHNFEHVSQDNIIFGIDEITINSFFELYQDLLVKTMNYGFPTYCSSLEQLRDNLKHENIRAFVIDSSLGLCGFVLGLHTPHFKLNHDYCVPITSIWLRIV